MSFIVSEGNLIDRVTQVMSSRAGGMVPLSNATVAGDVYPEAHRDENDQRCRWGINAEHHEMSLEFTAVASKEPAEAIS